MTLPGNGRPRVTNAQFTPSNPSRVARLGSRLASSARIASSLALSILLAAGTFGGCAPRVVRISDGRVESGRTISADAYAAFLRGRLHELEGDTRLAIRDYEATIEADPKAGEAWSRLGALHCTTAPEAAERAFERAESIDPRSVAFLRARSLCASERRQFELGRSAAERALEVAPADPGISRLAISANLTSGHTQRALELAWAHTSAYPSDSAGWDSVDCGLACRATR
ncbi:MAG: hypothetical protein QM784_18595 [Polyangiaceae bacterium]